jgi:hypothetical protein
MHVNMSACVCVHRRRPTSPTVLPLRSSSSHTRSMGSEARSDSGTEALPATSSSSSAYFSMSSTSTTADSSSLAVLPGACTQNQHLSSHSASDAEKHPTMTPPRPTAPNAIIKEAYTEGLCIVPLTR